jgi:hypothetical protein
MIIAGLGSDMGFEILAIQVGAAAVARGVSTGATRTC